MAAMLFAACSPAPPAALEEETPAPRYDVILVLVDTLRADHLGTYGYPRNTSPNLDRFARRNLQFADPRSQAACTFPSVNSLLTSRYPAPFLTHPDGFFGIPEEIPSLAQMLQRAGYETAAVSASPIVRQAPSPHNPDGGFDPGFDRFFEKCMWRSGHCIQRQAGELLRGWAERREAGETPPYFLYLHYMEPHGPYQPPRTFARRFAQPRDAPDWVLDGDPNPIADRLYKEKAEPQVAKADLEHLIDLYDDEIAFFDLLFGRLLAILEQLGLSDSTILVVASDHGEEFLEHGHVKHCRTLYDSSTRTPLLMRIPGARSSTPLPGPAANLDIVPTLLDYLGVEAEAPLDGRSLRPIIERGIPVRQYAYSSQGPLRSVNNARFKLVADLASQQLLLFDRVADPAELRNRLQDGRQPPPHLRHRLHDWLALAEGGEGAESGLSGAQRAQERLRALGYLQ